MKYVGVIGILVVSLVLGSGAWGNYQDEKVSHVYDHRVLMVENPYPDRLQITHLCVYSYKSPWKGVCQQLNQGQPYFKLVGNQRLSDIQRIALVGRNLGMHGMKASCLVHFDHSPGSVDRLRNSRNYVVDVNYITGEDLVCQLRPEV